MQRRVLVCLVFTLVSTPSISFGQNLDAALPPAYCNNAKCTEAAQFDASREYAKASVAWEAAIPEARVPDGEVWQLRVDLLTKAAAAAERAAQYDKAGTLYWKASRAADRLAPFLAFKAAESLSQRVASGKDVDRELLQEVRGSDAFDHGFPRAALIRTRLDFVIEETLPEPTAAEDALTAPQTSEEACTWLSGLVVDANTEEASERQTALADLIYANCLPDTIDADFEHEPSHGARVGRASHWYGAVRFPEAFEELSKVDFDELSEAERCDSRFLLGRTLYRLRKRNEALKAYVEVVDNCSADVAEDSRVRSLYAAGKRHYRLDRYEKSKKYYTQLLEEFPERSHADDALLYLARIARAQGDDDVEPKLVRRALEDYPDGDMVHEIVWEYVEDDVKAGNWKTFLETMSTLDLPEQDTQYYSQGRLGYLEGLAHHTLGDEAAAAAAWQRTWTAYPFSFYGYIARQKLLDVDVEPASLAPGERGWVDSWFADAEWAVSPAGRLARIGLFDLAGDAQHAAIDDSEPGLWRLAYLYHRAGDFDVSHNIVRRGIDGRPWVGEPRGRMLRWTVAWPNPFAAEIANATALERRQADDEYVLPALASAIMREESSFIEDVESWAGALGLMQLMPSTALDHDDDIEGKATPDKLKTAEVNVRVGVDHLYSLARRFESHPVVMVAAYNAGGGAASSWLDGDQDIALWVEDIPYDQTRNYTKRVIGSYGAYQWLGGLRKLDDRVADNPPD